MANEDTNPAVLKELHELRRRLEELEQRQPRPSFWRARSRTWVAVASVTVAGLAGIALASPVCANGIPFCFQPDQPALAAEMNTNFAQLKTWLETKTGATGTVASPSNAITTGSLTTTGAISMGAVIRQNINLWNTQYGIGVQNATAYLRTADAFAWFKNGVHSDTQFDPGAGGQLMMRLDNAGTLNTAGSVISSGYDISCATGTSGYHYGFCCRMNIRNGATSCKNGTATTFPSWSAAPDPFVAGAEGRYSLDCAGLSTSANYPICCRTDMNGSTSCVISTAGGPLAWQAVASPW